MPGLGALDSRTESIWSKSLLNDEEEQAPLTRRLAKESG